MKDVNNWTLFSGVVAEVGDKVRHNGHIYEIIPNDDPENPYPMIKNVETKQVRYMLNSSRFTKVS